MSFGTPQFVTIPMPQFIIPPPESSRKDDEHTQLITTPSPSKYRTVPVDRIACYPTDSHSDRSTRRDEDETTPFATSKHSFFLSLMITFVLLIGTILVLDGQKSNEVSVRTESHKVEFHGRQWEMAQLKGIELAIVILAAGFAVFMVQCLKWVMNKWDSRNQKTVVRCIDMEEQGI